jgi:hypothetical protein
MVDSPYIPEIGTPRLDANAWFWDDEANERADNGTLGISTDFNCPIEGEQLTGYLTPNYVACFPIETVNQQQDIGARITNSNCDQHNEVTKMDEDTKSAFARLEGLFTGFISSFKGANVQNSAPEENNTLVQAEPISAVPVEYLEQIETLKTEKAGLESKVAEVQTSYETLKQEAEARAEQDKKAEAARLEAVWQTNIMPKLPAGLLIDEVKKAEIKKMAIEQPLEFMQQYGDMLNKTDANIANSNPQSQTHQNSSIDDADKPVVIGSFNAKTGGYN